jgi:hypothetical protein
VKSGWAAIVLVGGTRSAPLVLDSRRLELSDPATPATLQPHHAAVGTAQTDARVVRRLVGVIEQCARSNATRVLVEYRTAGQVPGIAVVVGTSETDPGSITNPHIRIHALEGQLFRRVAAEALADAGVPTTTVLERRILAEAPTMLGESAAAIGKQLAMLRPGMGGPWRLEQKMAALAGWLQLPAGVQSS